LLALPALLVWARNAPATLLLDRRRQPPGGTRGAVANVGSDASAPHVRSFNWQSRSAVGVTHYLQ
jgi:hypothetical protein